jgi:hypothetical protein
VSNELGIGGRKESFREELGDIISRVTFRAENRFFSRSAQFLLPLLFPSHWHSRTSPKSWLKIRSAPVVAHQSSRLHHGCITGSLLADRSLHIGPQVAGYLSIDCLNGLRRLHRLKAITTATSNLLFLTGAPYWCSEVRALDVVNAKYQEYQLHDIGVAGSLPLAAKNSTRPDTSVCSGSRRGNDLQIGTNFFSYFCYGEVYLLFC